MVNFCVYDKPQKCTQHHYLFWHNDKFGKQTQTSFSIVSVMSVSVLDVDFIRRTNGTTFPHSRSDAKTSNSKYRQGDDDVTDNSNWLSGKNSVTLSRKSLLEYSSDGARTKAVFFIYNQLHHILRDAENHLQSRDDLASHQLNSLVISASLGNGRHIQLPSPVRVTLAHLNKNFTDPVCAFWDYELSGWSDAGCRTVVDDVTRDDVTSCECDHLTNFGLLMRPTTGDRATGASLSNNGSPINKSTVRVLEIVTYVAVALSVIFIVVILYRVSCFASTLTCLLPKARTTYVTIPVYLMLQLAQNLTCN